MPLVVVEECILGGGGKGRKGDVHAATSDGRNSKVKIKQKL